MKVHLIYFSPGGTTKRTVRNIAEGMGDVEIIEHDMLVQENRRKKYNFKSDDLVILGMMTGTKLFGVPQEVFNAIKGNNTPLVGVVMYGNGYYGKSLIFMKREVESRGFKMVAGGAFIGQSSLEPKIAAGRPDAKDKEIQLKFGEDIYEKVVINRDFSFKSKLKMNWSKDDAVTVAKCAIISALPGYSLKMPYSMSVLKINDDCIGCKKCERHCPVGAIDIDTKSFDSKKCIGCAGCINTCPKKAISYTNKTLKNMMKKLEVTRAERKEPEVFF
ncbi:EFR1 family ferrodoxin [Wukongibacter baidiensis]|uniref:EFR1 family ferrodoxin n=1 Tax=Wukongibacter baidiensis TaxID=1723361 RepID=UPI003D7F81C5